MNNIDLRSRQSKKFFYKNFPLLLIFLLAIWLRVIFVLNFQQDLYGDQPSQLNSAWDVAKGVYFSEDGNAYWPPGSIILSGVILSIFHDYHAILYMQAVMGAITVFFINGIASRFFGYFAGLIAAFLYAIYIPFIYYTGLILSETTFFFFTFAALFMLSRFYCSNKKSELVFAGVLFGLSALTRPVSLPLPILAFFLFLFRKDDSENIPRFFRAIKTTLALLLVVFLTIVPWSIRNWIVEGEPVFIDVNAGVNFYIGHNPRSTGWYVYMDAEDPIIKQQMTPEGDRAGRKAAFDYISNHIEETKSLFFKVHNAFWNVNDFDIEEKGKVLKDIVNKFQLPALEFLDLKFLSWIGVLALIIYPRTSIYIALFILSYNIVIDFIYFAPRYRMVIEPFLILLIAGGTNVITNLLKVSFRLGR